jgi:drug/metabolite transporter (DMT)-like permease
MALLVNLQPILTALFTVLFLHQSSPSDMNHATETPVSPRQWLGLMLGLAGVTLVLSTKLSTVNYNSFGWFAVMLGVGALLCITLGTLYQKQFCPSIDPRASQTVQSLASFCVTLPFALSIETKPVLWTIQLWGALIFSVVVLSGIGTGLLLWLINRGAATKVTAYLYWVPPVSSLLAWVMFDERITPLAWPGFILVALGVMLVVKQSISTKKI